MADEEHENPYEAPQFAVPEVKKTQADPYQPVGIATGSILVFMLILSFLLLLTFCSLAP